MDAFLRRCVMLPPLEMAARQAYATTDNTNIVVKKGCCSKKEVIQANNDVLLVSMPQYRHMV